MIQRKNKLTLFLNTTVWTCERKTVHSYLDKLQSGRVHQQNNQQGRERAPSHTALHLPVPPGGHDTKWTHVTRGGIITWRSIEEFKNDDLR